jgi:hypothetical protein
MARDHREVRSYQEAVKSENRPTRSLGPWNIELAEIPELQLLAKSAEEVELAKVPWTIMITGDFDTSK